MKKSVVKDVLLIATFAGFAYLVVRNYKQRKEKEIEKIKAKIIYAIRPREDTHPIIFIFNISHSFGLCLKVCSTTIKRIA